MAIQRVVQIAIGIDSNIVILTAVAKMIIVMLMVIRDKARTPGNQASDIFFIRQGRGLGVIRPIANVGIKTTMPAPKPSRKPFK